MDLKEVSAFEGLRHPWELERVRIIERITREAFAKPRPSVLDVGGGDGFMAKQLVARYPAARVVAVDPGYTAGVAAGIFGGTGIKALPRLEAVGRERFDLILLLDVLEHVADDLGLLRTCACKHLCSTGRALVFAPAFSSLFGDHDRTLGHLRRYRLPALRRLAAAADLRVEQSGYLFLTPLLLRSLAVLEKRLHRPPHPRGTVGVGNWTGGSAASRLARLLLGCENELAVSLAKAGIRLPGLTAWMLCRRS